MTQSTSVSDVQGQQQGVQLKKPSTFGMFSFLVGTASILAFVIAVPAVDPTLWLLLERVFIGGLLLSLGLGIAGLLKPNTNKTLAIVGITVSALAACGILALAADVTDNDPAPMPTQPFADPPGTVTNSIGMKLVPIQSGEFLMGSPADCPLGNANEEFQHRVRITKPFLLGMYEVTQSQYEQVMQENPSRFQGAHLPVENLSWKDAQRFCEFLSELPAEQAAGRRYRLPTEAEWEYACRAGTITAFSLGAEITPPQARSAKIARHTQKKPATVGTYPPNAWGLYDMHGNVWEWTKDYFSAEYFHESPLDDPQGPASGSHHTLRGGSASVESYECRSAIRGEAAAADAPETKSRQRYPFYGDFGIRVVCLCDSPVSETNGGSQSADVKEKVDGR